MGSISEIKILTKTKMASDKRPFFVTGSEPALIKYVRLVHWQ
jgi:hypothetical protein